VRIIPAETGTGMGGADAAAEGADGWPETPDVRIIPAGNGSGNPDWWPFNPDGTDPALSRAESGSTDPEQGTQGESSGGNPLAG